MDFGGQGSDIMRWVNGDGQLNPGVSDEVLDELVTATASKPSDLVFMARELVDSGEYDDVVTKLVEADMADGECAACLAEMPDHACPFLARYNAIKAASAVHA